MLTATPRLDELSDKALLSKAAELAYHERLATAELIVALAEIDERKLYLGEGCSSMFSYCTRVLHLSEHAAYDRIEASRLGRRFPVVFDRLVSGALTLTNLRLLGPHLTDDAVQPLLDEAAYKSKDDVERTVARLRSEETGEPELFTIQIVVTAETRDKLRLAQDVMRHTIPDGNAGAIIDRSLTLLLADVEKKRTGFTNRPRNGRPPRPGSRHIPRRVRREVWARDGGQCAFTGDQGRCQERGLLEFHHVQPYGAGGAAVAANIQLRCRAHNQYEAEMFFGRGTSWPFKKNGAELVPEPVQHQTDIKGPHPPGCLAPAAAAASRDPV